MPLSKEEILKKVFSSNRILPPSAEYQIPLISKAMDEYAKQEAIGFEKWKSRLSPSELCTVHPPAGSGMSHGIYNLTDEELYIKYVNQKEYVSPSVGSARDTPPYGDHTWKTKLPKEDVK